jgi:hypothetical protein
MVRSALVRASRTVRFAAILRDAAKTPLLRVCEIYSNFDVLAGPKSLI